MRAGRYVSALWNEGLCGRERDRPQLMRMSLGRHPSIVGVATAEGVESLAPVQVAPSLPGLLKQPAASRDGHEDSSSSACPGRPAALHGRRGGAPGKARRASEWRCGLTSKCSRQAGSVPRSARAQRPVRTLRNVSLCGRRHDRLQLICIPLGGFPGIAVLAM